MHEAELVFSFPPEIARAVAGALAPESETQVPKTRADVTSHDGAVRVHLYADDLSALRAGVNSYARWVEAAERAAGIGRT